MADRSAPRRFAEDTKVPVSKSRASIEAALKKEGAVRIATMDEASESLVMFTLAGRLIKLRIAIDPGVNDQKRRAIWRAVLLVVKAKIEAVAQGIATVEQEWLAYVVLPDGQTVADWIEPKLQLAYEQGTMPTHPLMLEGPKGGPR